MKFLPLLASMFFVSGLAQSGYNTAGINSVILPNSNVTGTSDKNITSASSVGKV